MVPIADVGVDHGGHRKGADHDAQAGHALCQADAGRCHDDGS